MAQTLLFPDPQPLVKRLGQKFFQRIPRRPGVYKMQDVQGNIVYVGKAKDLRQRLANYRIANPEQLPKRRLRLLREVVRIEFELCPSESAALKQEAKLIRELKPKFNRAGVWATEATFSGLALRGAGHRIRHSGNAAARLEPTRPLGWSCFAVAQCARAAALADGSG